MIFFIVLICGSKMEERYSDRTNAGIKISVNNQPGILVDASKTGLGVKLLTDKVPTSDLVDVLLEHEQKNVYLKGKISWLNTNVTFQNEKEVGIMIKDAPAEYYDFLERIQIETKSKADKGLFWLGMIFVILLLFAVIVVIQMLT